ncbi:hypothetical protein AQUCO_04400138v1 [Aquilegia coerulea]|uniref:Uncharacterized protein n=1 Tax=Aquilegia coerulea TaxID=218851 RepID=A0A2G5CN72_AQUCA|nr:hypothetical protein AQUCO_04400138v1 [Aquilegia coerulea]
MSLALYLCYIYVNCPMKLIVLLNVKIPIFVHPSSTLDILNLKTTSIRGWKYIFCRLSFSGLKIQADV